LASPKSQELARRLFERSRRLRLRLTGSSHYARLPSDLPAELDSSALPPELEDRLLNSRILVVLPGGRGGVSVREWYRLHGIWWQELKGRFDRGGVLVVLMDEDEWTFEFASSSATPIKYLDLRDQTHRSGAVIDDIVFRILVEIARFRYELDPVPATAAASIRCSGSARRRILPGIRSIATELGSAVGTAAGTVTGAVAGAAVLTYSAVAQAVSGIRTLLPGGIGRRTARGEMPSETVVDDVHFMITAPSTLRPGRTSELIFWCHIERERGNVISAALLTFRVLGTRSLAIKSQGPVEVPRGAILTIALRVDGIQCEPTEKTVLWKGRTGNASFVITAPSGCAAGPRKGVASVRVGTTEIARIDFVLMVGSRRAPRRRVTATVSYHKTAFASYASPDRDQVITVIHGINKVAPHLDVFIDAMGLRSGTYWEQEIVRRIPDSDIFYLFWSRNAMQSEWVEKEWRLAFETKGIDFIDPVPLEPRDVAPPPPELEAKQFSDPLLAFKSRFG